jgi:hypothetical protein
LYLFGLANFYVSTGLAEERAAVGVIVARPPRAVGAEASTAPMLSASETKEKEPSLTPDVVVGKERESTAAPEVGVEGKESVPKPTTEDAKDKVPSPSRVDAEVYLLEVSFKM